VKQVHKDKMVQLDQQDHKEIPDQQALKALKVK
jgi:hypothetical protein